MADHRVPRVLAIAGTDPSGGAGLIADIKSIAALGGYGMGAVTAVTVQNTQGVTGIHSVPIETIIAQLDAVADDVQIDAVKIGMLGDARLVEAVSQWISDRCPPQMVLDPVMVATTGSRLVSDDAADALVRLAGRASLVTPNVPELGVLAGHATATTLDEVETQARKLCAQIGTSVLATTGDLAQPTGNDSRLSADVLATCSSSGTVTVTRLPFVRIATSATHGTGCSLSSALATAVVRCDGDWFRAYQQVRPWIDGALGAAEELNVGHGSGPLDHTWFLHR